MPNRQHVLRLESDALGTLHVEVARLEGREAVGSLFELEITLVTKDPAGLPVDDLVGADARLVFELDGREVRRLGGMIAVVDDLLDPESRFSTYRALFVPRAYRLTQRETLDVHLDLSEPELFAKKLGEIGLAQGDDFELRLVDTYPKRELVVQYRETDLAFVSRLAEHLGISFWVEARDGRDVVVFADRNEGFSRPDPDLPVPFRPRGDGCDVYALEQRSRVVPTKHVLRDYNYRNPGLDMTATAELEGGSGSVVEYGAHFKDPSEGARFARIRLEEQLCRSKTFRGKSDLPGLVVGSRVVLEGHPRGDIEIIVVEVAHRGDFGVFGSVAPGGRAYENDFVAIRAGVPFRPARVTPKPRVHGVMTGVVDGASDSEYAQIDEEGRYRVKFMFDTADRDGGQASRPVRMAQPHAGEGYGMHFPLRAGVEVIITCVDGDPDRPIIAGTVPNPATPSPVAAANGTRNVIRTGGGNQIDMDDTDGAQRIKLSSPRMNTVFQLGEPNAPELGAVLTTDGASSTFALAGSNLVSSFNTCFSSFQSLATSGDITTVASKAEILDILGGIGGFVETVLTATSILWDTANGVMDIMLAESEVDVAKAQGVLDEKQAAVDASRVDIDAKSGGFDAAVAEDPADSPATAEAKKKLRDAKAAVDEATTTLDDGEQAWSDARAAMEAAEREEGTSSTLYLNRKKVFDALDAERTAALAVLDPVAPTDPKATPSPYVVLRDGTASSSGPVKEYHDALVANEPAAQALAVAKADVHDKQRVLDADTYSMRSNEHAERAAVAKWAYEKAHGGITTISEALNGINVVKSFFTQKKEALSWATLGKRITGQKRTGAAPVVAPVKGVPTIFDAEFVGATAVKPRSQAGAGLEWSQESITAKGRATHTLGADHNLLLFGEEVVALRGKTIGAWGANEISLYSSLDAALLSAGTAEVKGVEMTYLGGKLIDVLADEKFVVAAEKAEIKVKDEAYIASKKDLVLMASKLLELQSEDATKIGTKSMKVAVQEKLAVDADELAVTALGEAKLSASKGLEAASGMAKLKLGSSGAVVEGNATTKLDLASAGATLKGATVTVDGTGTVKVNGSMIQLG